MRACLLTFLPAGLLHRWLTRLPTRRLSRAISCLLTRPLPILPNHPLFRPLAWLPTRPWTPPLTRLMSCPRPVRGPPDRTRHLGQGPPRGQGRDQAPHPGHDVAVEILGRGLPPLDVLEPLLPLRGQFRAAQGFGHQPDEGLTLGGGPQLLALALHVAGADELLDDLGPRRRRAQAGLLHGGGEGVVLDLPPRVLHGRQQAGIVIGPRGLGLLLHHLQTGDLDDLAEGEGRQGPLPFRRLFLADGGWRLAVRSRLSVIATGWAAHGLTCRHSHGLPGGWTRGLPSGGAPARGLGALPAGVQHPAATGEELGAADVQDHPGLLQGLVGEKDGDETGGHQLEDTPGGLRHARGRALARGEDGMMVGEPGVVDIGLAKPVAPLQPGQGLGGQGMLQATEDGRQAGDQVLGDVAAFGPGVADELVGLVEGLGLFQDLGGGEAEAAIGVPLQARQVIEGGRAVVADLALQALDPAGLVGCEFAVQPLGLGAGVDAGLPVAAVAGAKALRQGRHQFVEEGRDEAGDGLVPGHDHRQGRRLHPADGAENAIVDGVAAGEVHAHQPVRLGAGPRRPGQGIEGTPGLEPGQPFADRLVGQAGDPQALDGLTAAGMLVDEAEDMLPLAAGIRGADDGLGIGGVEQPFDDPQLAGRPLARAQLPVLRDHGQLGQGPARRPGAAIVVGLGEVNQMAQGPGDAVATPLQIPLPPPAGAQHPGQVAGNAGFFGKDEDAHGGRVQSPSRTRFASLSLAAR